MSDKQVKVAKPEKLKPAPVKPAPVKPESVKPVKAYTNKHCVRCACEVTPDTGRVRALCSQCDVELQAAHWGVEHVLFNRTVYMPEKGEAQWFKENGYDGVLFKPTIPRRRNQLAVSVPAMSP